MFSFSDSQTREIEREVSSVVDVYVAHLFVTRFSEWSVKLRLVLMDGRSATVETVRETVESERELIQRVEYDEYQVIPEII